MNTSIGENNPLTLSHCKWLGLKNENGALVIKTLNICKDLNDIVIPIANAEIAERNRKRAEENR